MTPMATVTVTAAYLAVLFVLDAGNDALAVIDGRGPGGPLGFLTNAVLWWGAWVGPLWIGLTFARSVSPDIVGWPRSVAANLGVSVLLVLAHLLIVSFVFGQITDLDPGPTIGRRMYQLGTRFVMAEFLTVWGAVALLYSFVFGARLHAKELEAARLRASMSEARLEALRREISPHFLFNALNSVGGLVRSNRGGAAAEMIEALATLLRRSLERDDRTEVRLDEELELLDQYVRVEKARWGEALQVEMTLEEGLEGAAVPPLVLQPIVENAIRYGAAGAGPITIAGTDESGVLLLSVSNSMGATSEPPRGGLGIGLANTRERLDCLHGSASSLEVSATPDGGTVAELRVPLRRLDQSIGVGAPHRMDVS